MENSQLGRFLIVKFSSQLGSFSVVEFLLKRPSLTISLFNIFLVSSNHLLKKFWNKKLWIKVSTWKLMYLVGVFRVVTNTWVIHKELDIGYSGRKSKDNASFFSICCCYFKAFVWRSQYVRMKITIVEKVVALPQKGVSTFCIISRISNVPNMVSTTETSIAMSVSENISVDWKWF